MMRSEPLFRREPFLLTILSGCFVGLPLWIAKGIWKLLSKLGNPALKWSSVALISLGSVLSVFWISRLFEIILPVSLECSGESFCGFFIPRIFVFYGTYLIITLPLFLIMAYLHEESKFFKSDRKKHKPNLRRMWKGRLKSDQGKVYLGHSFDSGRPVYLTNFQRQMHTEVVGSTGTGKSESVLLPMLAHDIAHGKGAILIDGKGDLELLSKIRYIVEEKKREKDFRFFSIAHPHDSNTYNPLLRGNATELKDKIIGSISWSEEFYKRMAEQAILTLLNAITSAGHVPTFRELYGYLTNLTELQKLADITKEQVLKNDLGKMVESFKDNQKFLSGIIADLFITSRSDFSDSLDVGVPQIDLLKVYQEKQIVYFQLDLQGYGETARKLGRMIIQDIRTVSSYIQSNLSEKQRHFFPVFIDDASSFLEHNFIDFLNKCRAAGFAIMILHQSPGDLVFRGAPNFQQQVIENTNIKIILRQDDPFSVEKFTKIGGTRKTMIPTYQTENKITGKGFTGTGSIREGQTFRIEPDLIRALRRGEAAIIWKNPSFHTDHIKLDFFGHSSRPVVYKSSGDDKKKSRSHGRVSKKTENVFDHLTKKEKRKIEEEKDAFSDELELVKQLMKH